MKRSSVPFLTLWILVAGACAAACSSGSSNSGDDDGQSGGESGSSGSGGDAGNGSGGDAGNGTVGTGGRGGNAGSAGAGGGNAAGSSGNAAGSGGNAAGSGGNAAGSGGNAAGSGGNAAGSGGNAAGSGGNARLPKSRLYLMLGQSNMSGFAPVEDQDRAPLNRAMKMNQNRMWTACTEPVGIFSATVGPSRAFAAQLLAKDTAPDVKVYIINAAVAGSAIESWATPDSENYKQMIPFLDEGLKTAPLVGIIWHQGEANGGTAVEDYTRMLRNIIKNIRDRAKAPDAVFVAGEVGTESSPDDINRNPNRATRQMAMTDRLCGYVSSAGTTLLPDHVHYDGRSQRLLGTRYADKWIELALTP